MKNTLAIVLSSALLVAAPFAFAQRNAPVSNTHAARPAATHTHHAASTSPHAAAPASHAMTAHVATARTAPARAATSHR